jgi:hypothetical protein
VVPVYNYGYRLETTRVEPAAGAPA